MKVRIIGGHGGVSKGHLATSYLINDELLVDAGSVAHGLTLEEQKNVKAILISHPHLDHIKDLAFLCDNFFGKEEAFQVYLHHESHKAIKDHLFNDIIWPDFTKLPSKERPTIIFNEVKSEESFETLGYKIMPVHVNHPSKAIGFIIEKNSKSLLFTQDTGPTDLIWEYANKTKNLVGVFSEISFVSKMEHIAKLSLHHTPKSFEKELLKIKTNCPIYVGHIKPTSEKEIIQEIKSLEDKRIHILEKDNTLLSF